MYFFSADESEQKKKGIKNVAILNMDSVIQIFGVVLFVCRWQIGGVFFVVVVVVVVMLWCLSNNVVQVENM